MNKKNIFICVSLLVYSIVTIAAEPAVPEALVNNVAEYQPASFTEQIDYVAQQVMANAAMYHKIFRAQYDDYMKASEIPIPKPIIKKSQPLVHLKKYKPIFNLATNQKYVVAATIACVIVAAIVYKYGRSSTKMDIVITAQEVQELVESVIHNPAIPKQDQLNIVFEVLIRNGLDNIVVHNDHLFEVNDMFKVEIKGRSVKVMRS
jgi:hypothetical protein